VGVGPPCLASRYVVSVVGVWDLDEERAREALSLWHDFPVGAQQRPLVLTGERVLVIGGFSSDEVKEALTAGHVGTTVAVPDEVLRAVSKGRQSALGSHHGAKISGARRATATFETDRGPSELPAWRVQFEGMDGYVVVLDPALARDAVGPSGLDGTTGTDMRAWHGEDERTVVLRFLGSPPEFTDYPRAVVLESTTAVAVVPVPVERVSGDRPLYAQTRQVAARLAEPLGARVLVDYRTGCPIQVTAAQPVASHPTKP
jgi:hypothetical protein